ncbi:hypothetical protein Cch01nite_09580 [Cellulomonas chitinilytica]|uniref:Acyltransferase 3 domain-containing protein n=1 Tax=Cellulomonas chitinilytica TaxID=398759 RepID=A0A919P351_9CELL|nr:acyltransferase [Cellulomonas chitinilytica]GIG20234.1 hypothetical protein Cch01nite_09580 [Cellulomonas chitinilytica]
MPDGRGDAEQPTGWTRSVGLRTRVTDAAAATPPHRDRYVDLLRAVAICVVVLGHWTISAVTVDDGRLGWVNALGVLTWAHPLTWLVQVMPVVFLVGGYANAASWASRSARGEDAAGWVRGRALRLLRPTAAFLAALVGGYGVAVALGADEVVARTAIWAAAMSLWFLVVYLAVVSLAPVLLAADRRWGLWGVLGLVGVVAAGDVARLLTGTPAAGAASYVAAWVAVHQLGVAWYRGALTRGRWPGWALAGGGLTVLVALTGWGPYAVTMVGGAPPPALANTAPPTLALLALASAQTGVVLLLRPAADRWLRRPRVWLAVVAVNAVVLTVYLWHMVPVVVVGTTLVRGGVLPQHDVGSGAWWAWRLPWLAVLTVLLVAIVAVAGRWERPRSSAERAAQSAWTTGAGVVASLAGLAGLGVGGPDGLLPAVSGVPVGELLLFSVGLVLLVGRPRQRRGGLGTR